MIIKTVFKSHFKIKFKNKNKYIFCKNILTFLLFSKIFFKKCNVSIKFEKIKKLQTSFLKAPSRHKKFFHQIYFEFFILKLFLIFKFFKITPQHCTTVFNKLLNIFNSVGSNTLYKYKTVISLNLNTNKLFLINYFN